ncbi:hypothetical protein F2Q69_00051016, partial [Brassica cretica]
VTCLRVGPESLACELVTDRRYPQFGKSHVLLMDDKNPRIQSEAKLLYTLWLRYLYATRRKQCPRSDKGKQSQRRDRVHNQQVVVKNKNNKKKLVEEEMIWTTTGILTGTKCVRFFTSPCLKSLTRFFRGSSKSKYRSILFNIGDSSNPNLRRKVLIGEISGERLVTMEKEEMASNKIQMQVQKIKEKARVKEENRVKSMMMFQSGSVIMT